MKNLNKSDVDGAYPPWIIGLVILGIVIFNIIFPTSQLPDNCHRTTSVDVGGSEIECD